MSETVKLIIEIPKDYYEILKCEVEQKLTDYYPFIVIGSGIPLDSNSERAEVQAYFDGQAYGWEQERKALIDDVKAELDNLRNQRLFGMVSNYDLLDTVLEILDNIGKGDSEC